MRSLFENIHVVYQAGAKAIRKIPYLDILRQSESPVGFAAIAGMGLAAVVILNITGGGQDHSGSSQTYSEIEAANTQTLTQNTSAEPAIQAVPEEAPVEPFQLRRNETLIGLLERAKINRRNAHAVVAELDTISNLRKLQRGQEIRLQRNIDNPSIIQSLWMRDAFAEQSVVEQEANGYRAERAPVKTISLTRLIEGTITDNLYLSAKRAGLPDSVIIELIRMMSFNVDFEREIREGDTFQVYFERRYAPDFDDTENGRILYVDLGLKRQPLNATWHEDANGEGGYYDDSGESTRRALMKTPLDVAVVTSRYGRRKHPVLGYTRMHKGVDFRAPTGTPIMAAGDGVIEMAARNGSYGNYVRIRHNGSYKTAYGHLSKFGRGIKRGSRVKQGQIIGYSGATGRVTAAHLHYEVLVGGKQTNPLTLELPTGRTLEGTDLRDFQNRRNVIIADIDRVKQSEALFAVVDTETVETD